VPRLAPGLKDLLPVLVALAALATAEDMLSDGDIGWHVLTGQQIWLSGSVPRQDPYSFSAPGQPWYAWEWLSDLIMAALHGGRGLAALVAASAFALALSFSLVQRLGLALGGRPLATFALTALGASASTVHWLARPHVVTFVLLPVFLAVLEAGAPGRRRWPLLLLVPLTALWANLHGGFLAGLLLVGAYLAGSFLPGAPRRWRPADLVLVLLLCVAATALNPYGLELHRHLASYLGRDEILRHIAEFRPPDFQTAHGRLLELWLLCVALALGPVLRARDWPRAFVLLGFVHMTLTSHRHVDLLAVAGAPLLAATLASSRRAPEAPSPGLAGTAQRFDRLDAGHAGLWGLPAAFGLCVVFAAAQGAGHEPLHFPADRFPVQAAGRLAELGGRRVLCTDSFGGYLLYRQWPRLRVFVDGRSDFYVTTPVFGDYLAMLRLEEGWVERIERHAPDSAVLPSRHPAARALLQAGGWTRVYEDAVAVVLQRQAAAP
jgi:hypothetical protein